MATFPPLCGVPILVTAQYIVDNLFTLTSYHEF